MPSPTFYGYINSTETSVQNYESEYFTDACSEGRVLCHGGTACIYEHQICDGHVNCDNATDESECGMYVQTKDSRV